MTTLCAISGCTLPAHARGWCNTHYNRWKRHGDPLRANRIYRDDLPRLESYIDRTDGCWLWTGARNPDGYGRFTYRGSSIGAHRAAYLLLVGPIPVGLTLDHLCRTRHCVNPAHLEPVTAIENTKRGEAWKVHGLKTHCPKGHAYTDENTYRWNGKRSCRACHREVERARRRERVAA